MKNRLFFTLNFVLLLSSSLFAQCNPQVRNTSGTWVTSATFCEDQLIEFRAASPGFTTVTNWNFSPNTSSAQNPTYSYENAGSYTVKFTGSGPGGTCTENLSITILPSPEIHIMQITSDSQCFENNNFCFRDTSTALSGLIAHQRYAFSNGSLIHYSNPTHYGTNQHIDSTICLELTNPTGGSFDLVVESEHTNGCITTSTFTDYLFIYPKIGAELKNTTTAPNPSCGSTLGTFQNISQISLADVDSFEWDFGDGTKKSGNSDSSALWANASHLYTSNGTFNTSIKIYAKSGCINEYTLTAAVSNLVLDSKITHYPTHITAIDNPVTFRIIDLPGTPGVNTFLWNFGDPTTGAKNYESNILFGTEHHFSGLGTYLISLRIELGPCDVTLLDTIQVLGPLAKIEAPYNRIAFAEKFQCGTNDSIHFTNSSQFYYNDDNIADEDSTIIVNGKSIFQFNYTPPASGGIGTGDQTAIPSVHQNRAMGSQVKRLWDFGDKYAPRCTTSTAKGQNIGMNCNFSEDEFPVHKYQHWDSIYYNNYYLTNHRFFILKYNESGNFCYTDTIDSTNASKHYELFERRTPVKYIVHLYLNDTVNNTESQDQVFIDLTKPDASKMTLSSGTPCPYNGSSSDHILNFDLNTGGQSYFAVNFDTLTYGGNNFTPYNQGILAPPTPGSPVPFSLPYTVQGALGDEFVKGYTPGEIGSPDYRGPQGSFTMGLIVGNGPAVGGQPATCLDTAYYPNIFKIPYLDAAFEITSPSSSIKNICAGDAAYFKINNPIQNDISALRWAWGHQNIGKGPGYEVYAEQFKYFEKYHGPSPTRNDKDITYNGEDWYFNYVIRATYSDLFGGRILDTIVTSILKDWNEEFLGYGPMISLFNTDDHFYDIPKECEPKLWGDGTFGCIDTTGSSSYFNTNKLEYKSENGDSVFMIGDRRYRYTNSSHNDSIEVAHILHFRDSSLQGYDTLINGSDTTYGVWKHDYTYTELVNGVPTTRSSNGPMTPFLTLINKTGCQSHTSKLLNVGFLSEFSLAEDAVCTGEVVQVSDSIRYYQYGQQDFLTYPIHDFDFWKDPTRYINNIETFEADWDSTDGTWDGERSIVLNHLYTTPGEYTITIVTKDSSNCRDTSYLTAIVSTTEANFGIENNFANCASTFNFSDSSILSTSQDFIIKWEWDFGDGTIQSILKNPSHQYTRGGYFDVKLKVWSALGCVDSIEKRIYISGPQPEFESDIGIWLNDTPVICVGDSITLANISQGDINTPSFIMDWGDGYYSTAASIGSLFSHQYNTSGTFELFLTQEDEIPGTGTRCSRTFPDTNPDLMIQHRIVVIVNENPEVKILGRATPTYQRHPTEFKGLLDSRYTRLKWIVESDTVVISMPDTSFIYKFANEGFYNVILAPEYDILPRCWDRDTFRIQVLHSSLNTITDLQLLLDVHPNPTQGEILVSVAKGLDISDITLIDLVGKETILKYNYSEKSLIKISNPNLPSGTYYLKIRSNKGLIYKKIVILKE
ncbi:MAG: hypothetical protein COA58_09370 [Bacteroidetes bacterium]|nr:MAG: hypothetical protein COA58_09370 [Bacteroidota bacterium]